MTYNHAIWQEQDYHAGKKTLLKLGKTQTERIEKAKTELEKDFIEAVEILYGEGTKIERDKDYADYMGTLYEKYPGNHEVASLYALSVLGSVAVGRDENIYQKSARISESILKENPNHPGALHYFIHANDDPYHANEALFAALELAGLKAWKQNDLVAAGKLFKEASELELRVSYSYGPPSVVKPSHELYREFLLSINRPDDAMKAFDAALQRAPKRVLSLKGKMEAAKMLNHNDVALEIEKQLP